MGTLALFGLLVISGPVIVLSIFAFICLSVEEMWK